MQPVSNSQVFLRGFVVYFLAFSALSSALSLLLFGAGWVFTIVSALLVFRSSHQTLWDQMTSTTVGFQKK
jgi:CHASE2 domain-containing sensor protein